MRADEVPIAHHRVPGGLLRELAGTTGRQVAAPPSSRSGSRARRSTPGLVIRLERTTLRRVRP
ncbi:hypothetical protein [Geodermatophilus sp. SYSU D00710]